MSDNGNNGPYTLFQGSDGKWGSKDKDGNVQMEAFLMRSDKDPNTFYDLETVCEFDTESGMSLVAWRDYFAFIPAQPKNYPDDWYQIVVDNRYRAYTPEDRQTLQRLWERFANTDILHKMFDEMEFAMNCEFNVMLDSWDAEEERWLAEHVDNYTTVEKVDALRPIVESSDITDDEKVLLLVSHFCYQDEYSDWK